MWHVLRVGAVVFVPGCTPHIHPIHTYQGIPQPHLPVGTATTLLWPTIQLLSEAPVALHPFSLPLCVHTHLYTHLYIHTCTHTHTHTPVHTHLYTRTCTHTPVSTASVWTCVDLYTGTANGGSALLWASVMELSDIDGRIVTVSGWCQLARALNATAQSCVCRTSVRGGLSTSSPCT